jgi:hypothetical protein
MVLAFVQRFTWLIIICGLGRALLALRTLAETGVCKFCLFGAMNCPCDGPVQERHKRRKPPSSHADYQYKNIIRDRELHIFVRITSFVNPTPSIVPFDTPISVGAETNESTLVACGDK